MSAVKVRARPDDFRSTYIEVGKVGAGEYYRAHWKTVDRWVEEEGKDGLRRARAEWVAASRVSAGPVQRARVPRRDTRIVDADDLSAACAYLRENRNGGWRVGLRDDGNYFVGRRECVPSEVVAMAVAKGMDEWYVERDMMKRLAMHEGVDEWVLEPEGMR